MDEKLKNIIKGLTPGNEKTELQFLLKCDILSDKEYTLAQEYMEKEERKKLLSQYKYAISYNKSKKLWFTYVDDPAKKNGRRQITKKNKKDLENLVIKIVKSGKKVTIEDVFKEYLELKKQGGIKQSTIDRYQSVFQRHFIATNNHNRDIKKLSPEWWCDFIESEAGREELTSKGISSLKGIIRGTLKRAKRKHLIDFTISEVFDDVEVKPVHKVKDNDSQIFTQQELPQLIEYLIENRDVHNLCILLMIITGVRVGELVCLKYDDFVSSSSFYVKRTETRYKTENGYVCEVEDEPKTLAGYRTVVFPKEYTWIIDELKRLRPFAEYLATNNKGERMTTNAIRKRLYRICGWLGFDYRKSPHKCRKTYCSILLDGGVDNSFILRQVGHVSISTTEGHYHFDRKTAEEKQELVDNILDFKKIV